MNKNETIFDLEKIDPEEFVNNLKSTYKDVGRLSDLKAKCCVLGCFLNHVNYEHKTFFTFPVYNYFIGHSPVFMTQDEYMNIIVMNDGGNFDGAWDAFKNVLIDRKKDVKRNYENVIAVGEVNTGNNY